MRGRVKMTPAQRASMKAMDDSFNQTFTLPMAGIPATTTQPSVRNFVHNIQSLPGAFNTMATNAKNILTSIGSPSGKYKGRRR